MQRPEFVELRRELRSRGYSRRYITRLLAELSDHYQCTQEAYSELDPPSGTGLQNDNASEQECTLERMPSELGSVNILSDAVDAHPELMPISRQHPWLVFLWLPGSLVVIYTALMSQVVASAIEFLPKSSFAAAMPHVPNIFFACDLVFLTLVLLVSAAMRSGGLTSVPYLCLTAGIVTAGATMQPDVVYCGVSDSLAAFVVPSSRWEEPFVVAVLAILICLTLVALELWRSEVDDARIDHA